MRRPMRFVPPHSIVVLVIAGWLAGAALPRPAGAASPVDLPVFARIDANYASGGVAAGLARADSVLAAARARGDARLESAALVYRAIGFNWGRNPREALALVDARMPVLRRQADAGTLAMADLTRGYALDALARFDEAVPAYERAAARAASASRPREVAYARLRLGFHWLQEGRSVDAARNYRAALRAAAAAGLAGISATAHVGLGNALHQQGDEPGAQREYYAAIVQARAAGSLVDEADALYDLGILQHYTGDAAKVVPMLERAGELFRRLRRPDKLVGVARALAMADMTLGYNEQADSLLASTLREVGPRVDPESRARLLAAQGMARLVLGREGEALGLARAAMSLMDSASVSGRCEVAYAAARIFARAGSPDSAMAVVEGQLARADVQHSERPRGQMELARALLFLPLGRPREAVEALRPFARGERHAGFTATSRFGTAVGIAQAQLALARPDSAAAWFELALNHWEAQRRTYAIGDYREATDAEASSVTIGYVALLLNDSRFGSRTARAARAFDVIQRFRGRSLTDRRAGGDREPTPVSCRVFQRRTLRPGEVFLDVLAGSDSTFVLAITSDSVLAWRTMGRDEFLPRMRLLRQALENASDRDVNLRRTAGAELGRGLLGPGAGLIARARTVIVSAGGVGALPWGALVLPGESDVLGMQHVMATCASATLLSELRRQAGASAGGRGTVVAACTRDEEGKPLRGVTREARDVAAPWPGARVVRDGAIGGAAGLMLAARGADVVHIAAHARSNQLLGWTHALLLGDPKQATNWLDAAAVAGSRTRARLCVLSACGSAGATWGDAVPGLASAWLAAGARCVVAMQWEADDESSAELMARFHRHLAAGETAGEAVRQAQREVRAMPRYAGPAHWAGVVLMGDPNVRVAVPPTATVTRR